MINKEKETKLWVHTVIILIIFSFVFVHFIALSIAKYIFWGFSSIVFYSEFFLFFIILPLMGFKYRHIFTTNLPNWKEIIKSKHLRADFCIIIMICLIAWLYFFMVDKKSHTFIALLTSIIDTCYYSKINISILSICCSLSSLAAGLLCYFFYKTREGSKKNSLKDIFKRILFSIGIVYIPILIWTIVNIKKTDTDFLHKIHTEIEELLFQKIDNNDSLKELNDETLSQVQSLLWIWPQKLDDNKSKIYFLVASSLIEIANLNGDSTKIDCRIENNDMMEFTEALTQKGLKRNVDHIYNILKNHCNDNLSCYPKNKSVEICGKILSRDTQEPIPSATIKINNKTYLSKENGEFKFTIDNFSNDMQLNVKVTHEDYDPLEREIDLKEEDLQSDKNPLGDLYLKEKNRVQEFNNWKKHIVQEFISQWVKNFGDIEISVGGLLVQFELYQSNVPNERLSLWIANRIKPLLMKHLPHNLEIVVNTKPLIALVNSIIQEQNSEKDKTKYDRNMTLKQGNFQPIQIILHITISESADPEVYYSTELLAIDIEKRSYLRKIGVEHLLKKTTIEKIFLNLDSQEEIAFKETNNSTDSQNEIQMPLRTYDLRFILINRSIWSRYFNFFPQSDYDVEGYINELSYTHALELIKRMNQDDSNRGKRYRLPTYKELVNAYNPQEKLEQFGDKLYPQFYWLDITRNLPSQGGGIYKYISGYYSTKLSEPAYLGNRNVGFSNGGLVLVEE